MPRADLARPAGSAYELDSAAADLAHLTAGLVVANARSEVPGFRCFGIGAKQIDAAMTALEPKVRRSVWNMQPMMGFDPHETPVTLNERSRRRGLDMQLLTSPRSRRFYPLITSEIPEVRFSRAPSQFILVDESVAIVGGPQSDEGYPTAWLTTRREVVGVVRSIWDESWRLSVAGVPPNESTPFTARQCLIARRLTTGAKDVTIARELGVSLRTVAADVAHILRSLEAGSRVEAAYILVGRSSRFDPLAPPAGPVPKAQRSPVRLTAV